jgi:hypothetical protein
MQHVGIIRLSPKISTLFNRVIHFFSGPRSSTPLCNQNQSNIDWPDFDPERDFKQPCHGSYKQPISGGYNEAFIVQYWTSYHLR